MFDNQIGGESANPNEDIEVASPPEDTVSSLEFSPPSVTQTFLVAGSWDKRVRCWEVEPSGTTVLKAVQAMEGPVWDVAWQDDGTKVFMASADKSVKCWDLASNQTVQVATHNAPVKYCHWVKAPNYTRLMTASWDKTLKFWDTRSADPVLSMNLSERCNCADVDYPMAVVGMAGTDQINLYSLESEPTAYDPPTLPSPLKKKQHRCIAVFRDKITKRPCGFALGSVEGSVAIQYVNSTKPNFTLNCHRSTPKPGGGKYIYEVSDVAIHPVDGTLATVSSDGSYSFWDIDKRTKLKSSNKLNQPLTKCAFNHSGQFFAYAAGYDWSERQQYRNADLGPRRRGAAAPWLMPTD